MNTKWIRPKCVPFPNKWCEFSGKKVVGGVKRKYWIQDISLVTLEKCLNVMFPAFVYEEPLTKFSSECGIL